MGKETRCNRIWRCLYGGGLVDTYMNWKKKGNIIEIKCMCGQSAIKKAQPLETRSQQFRFPFSFPLCTNTQTLAGVRERNYGFSQVYMLKSIKVTQPYRTVSRLYFGCAWKIPFFSTDFTKISVFTPCRRSFVLVQTVCIHKKRRNYEPFRVNCLKSLYFWCLIFCFW